MKIKKAIIPVAGMATRFLPAAKAQPKEMMPVVDKPVIQYIVEEAVAAGIEEIILVTAIGKRAIEDHFDRNFELEYRLRQKKKKKELATVAAIGRLAKFAFVRQTKPLGDGHAVLAALPFIDPDEPVAVLFGDDIISSKVPGIKQVIESYEKFGGSVVCMEKVPARDTHLYGIMGGNMADKNTMRVSAFVEKPPRGKAPSSFAAIGRYVLTPEIMKILKTQKPAKGGEIRLADAFQTALKKDVPLYGRVLHGTRHDCGNKLGYVIAQIEMGLEHPDIGRELKKYLKARG